MANFALSKTFQMIVDYDLRPGELIAYSGVQEVANWQEMDSAFYHLANDRSKFPCGNEHLVRYEARVSTRQPFVSGDERQVLVDAAIVTLNEPINERRDPPRESDDLHDFVQEVERMGYRQANFREVLTLGSVALLPEELLTPFALIGSSFHVDWKLSRQVLGESWGGKFPLLALGAGWVDCTGGEVVTPCFEFVRGRRALSFQEYLWCGVEISTRYRILVIKRTDGPATIVANPLPRDRSV
ncbi:MAG: hypothetical protein EXS49_00160 [Candidatus Pacebacteria bacterium]|nr:hypothetical protein [Candidatus Paceibacterota bacterium]